MCWRMSPWKRQPIALILPSTPERTMVRKVVLSWSKRWLIVTAILRRGFRDLGGNAHGGRHRVGDRLLTQDVDAVRDRQIDDRLVMRRRDHDGAEIRLVLGEGAARVGIAALGGKSERGAAVFQRLGIEIDQRDDLDGAVSRIGLQELAAPALAEHADADMDHFLRHAFNPNQVAAAGRAASARPLSIRCTPKNHSIASTLTAEKAIMKTAAAATTGVRS